MNGCCEPSLAKLASFVDNFRCTPNDFLGVEPAKVGGWIPFEDCHNDDLTTAFF
jgi:hypothetical protein